SPHQNSPQLLLYHSFANSFKNNGGCTPQWQVSSTSHNIQMRIRHRGWTFQIVPTFRHSMDLQCKSFRIRIYAKRDRKSFRIRIYEKQPGGGGAVESAAGNDNASRELQS